MHESRTSRLSSLLSRLENPGLTPGQERVLNAVLVAVMLVMTGGWAVTIAGGYRGEGQLTLGRELTANPLSADAGPPAAFVLDQLVRATAQEAGWRGRSGAVRAIIAQPGDSLALADTLGLDSLPAGATVEVQQVDSPAVRAPGERAEGRPGAWNVLLRVRNQVRQLADVAVLTPVSAELVEGGRIGRYLLGEWPARSELPSRLRTPEYEAPRGFIAVTPENRDVAVSEHLVLGDLLTKGQEDVWPKYTVVSPRMLDKVELTLQELERMGHPVENVGVISAFRHPHYNESGGNPSGRGSFSRHMYGDALDFYIDNDGNGAMDDLTGDGRVDVADARVVAEAANRVEQKYPEYVGGVGTYRPNPGAHSGFVHIDTRGYRARW